MRMRFKFGPKISASVIRPVVAGEKQDPEVGVEIDHFEAGDPGQVHVHLAVTVGASDPSTHSKLMAVHAIAFGPTDGLPTDPKKALQSTNPQGSVVATGHAGGSSLALPVKGVPEGAATILTVLVFDDDPPATSPATPAPAAAASATAAPAPATDDTPPTVATNVAPEPVATPATTSTPATPAAPTDPTDPTTQAAATPTS